MPRKVGSYKTVEEAQAAVGNLRRWIEFAGGSFSVYEPTQQDFESETTSGFSPIRIFPTGKK